MYGTRLPSTPTTACARRLISHCQLYYMSKRDMLYTFLWGKSCIELFTYSSIRDECGKNVGVYISLESYPDIFGVKPASSHPDRTWKETEYILTFEIKHYQDKTLCINPNLVGARFESASNCQNCCAKLWTSEFAAMIPMP